MGEIVKFQKKGVVYMARKYNDLEQFAKITLFFANNSPSLLYKTKLNKLLFYAQFLYYKTYSRPFITRNFIKDYYGPVMENLEIFLSRLERDEYISVISNTYGDMVKPRCTIADSHYSTEEMYILRKVLNKFGDYTSREISEESHTEPLWIEPKIKDIIPLEKAYMLNGIS